MEKYYEVLSNKDLFITDIYLFDEIEVDGDTNTVRCMRDTLQYLGTKLIPNENWTPKRYEQCVNNKYVKELNIDPVTGDVTVVLEVI